MLEFFIRWSYNIRLMICIIPVFLSLLSCSIICITIIVCWFVCWYHIDFIFNLFFFRCTYIFSFIFISIIVFYIFFIFNLLCNIFNWSTYYFFFVSSSTTLDASYLPKLIPCSLASSTSFLSSTLMYATFSVSNVVKTASIILSS